MLRGWGFNVRITGEGLGVGALTRLEISTCHVILAESIASWRNLASHLCVCIWAESQRSQGFFSSYSVFLPHQNELSANYIWARLGCCVVISHIGRIAVDTDDLYAVGIS